MVTTDPPILDTEVADLLDAEVAQLLAEVNRLAREHDDFEYGLPVHDDACEYGLPVHDAACVLAMSAVIRAALQRAAKLGGDSARAAADESRCLDRPHGEYDPYCRKCDY